LPCSAARHAPTTSAVTGHRFRVANIQVLRVRNGKIVSSRNYHDHLATAAALGQLHELMSSLTHQGST
jgi:uncharacterized protein